MNDADGHQRSRAPATSAFGIIAWIPVLVVLAALVRGFPHGHDWTFELVRVAEYGHALASGQLPPAWAENLYGGHGSPIFLYYAPLFAAVAAGFGSLLGSIPWGAVAALAGFAAIGAWTIRRAAFLATGGSTEAARIAVALYLLHPYLLCDMLLRNADAEFAALCVAPLTLCGVLELRERPQWGVLWLSSGLALTTVAHNLTAIGMAVLSLAAGLWLNRRDEERRAWIWLGLGLLLGVALAAFFWVPAVALQDLVRTETMLLGKFDFHHHFPELGALFGYARVYGAGWLPAALLLTAAFVVVRERSASDPAAQTLRGLMLGAALLLLLMQPLTTFVWEHLPLLAYLQFPWRLQGPLALLTALAGAMALARLLTPLDSSGRRAVEVAVLLLAIGNAAPHLLDSRPLGPRAQAWLTEGLEAASIRREGSAATVLDEYLPRTASKTAADDTPWVRGSIVAQTAGTRITVQEDRGSRLRLVVSTEEATELVFARWQFPGWHAQIDGSHAQIRSDPHGRIQLTVPTGEHQLELDFGAPPSRKLGLVISGLALAIWIGLLHAAIRRRA